MLPNTAESIMHHAHDRAKTDSLMNDVLYLGTEEMRFKDVLINKLQAELKEKDVSIGTHQQAIKHLEAKAIKDQRALVNDNYTRAEYAKQEHAAALQNTIDALDAKHKLEVDRISDEHKTLGERLQMIEEEFGRQNEQMEFQQQETDGKIQSAKAKMVTQHMKEADEQKTKFDTALAQSKQESEGARAELTDLKRDLKQQRFVASEAIRMRNAAKQAEARAKNALAGAEKELAEWRKEMDSLQNKLEKMSRRFSKFVEELRKHGKDKVLSPKYLRLHGPLA